MKRTLTRLLVGFLIGGLANQLPAEETPAITLPAATLPSASGGMMDLHKAAGSNGVVLILLSIDCPISNGYAPALRELAQDFQKQGINFLAVNPNAGQSLKQMEAHRREYQLQFPCLKDPGGEVAAKLHAQVCPEAFVFDSQGRLQYRGRIDDRFVRRGGAAMEVHSHDLKNALSQLVHGENIQPAKTVAIGCPLDLPAEKPVENAAQGSVVYTRDIAKILQERCQECHRPGGIGPFALQSYQDARRWADDIQDFTSRGAMPPWKAAAGKAEFANDRRLSKQELELIDKWVAAGCPQGDPADLPPPRKFPSGWRQGKPDLVIEAPAAYELAADGPDEYRCFVIPTDGAGDRYVKAIEVLPGNAKVVHHVLMFIDTSGAAERLDAADPRPGYATSGGYPGFPPSGGLGGWAPGNTYNPLPAGMAKILPAQAKIVMQVHYHKSGKPETDQTKIGLYFAKEPVERPVYNLLVLPVKALRGGLKIPPGDANFELRTALVLPTELLALGVTPHMHLLGKDMSVTATLPGGQIQPLITVNDWDFNWQESYRFREPITLPKGTRIDLVAHFDNSAANPYNPSRPPQMVKWGEQTRDEMCIAFVEIAPAAKAKSKADLREPTAQERIAFVLESRRLAGEPVDLSTLPLFDGAKQGLQRLLPTAPPIFAPPQ